MLCLNVLEYLDDPRAAIESMRGCLNPDGSLVILTPQQPSLYGALDRSMGHKRRFSRKDLEELVASQGFQVEKVYSLNKIGTPPWWIHSKMLGSGRIGKLTLKIFDKTVWIWRRIDWMLPWPGLSIVMVARKVPSAASNRSEVEQLTEVPAG